MTEVEPRTEAGQAMESWLREPEDYEWGRKVTDAILAIEREARGIPLIDVELLARAIAQSSFSVPMMPAHVENIAAEYTRLASESSPVEPDEAAAMRWLAANDLYAVTHIHESKDCAECQAGLPVEEGERPVPSRRADETYEQKQQRLRREEEDRL